MSIMVIAVLAAGVYWSRRPAPPLREVAARELTLREGRSYWQDETEPFTGIIFENYPDGSVRSRSQLSNGVLHGVSEGWHTNGLLQIQEHFQNGVSHGTRTKWFESGAKMSEAMIDQGKIQGVFRRWHTNGVLAEEVEMADNVPHGLSRSFYPNGSLKAEVRLDKGKVTQQQFWKENEAPALAKSAEPQ